MRRRMAAVAVAVVLGTALWFAVPRLINYDHLDEETVRRELTTRDIAGQPPAEARARLQAIHLPRGCELTIGQYNPRERHLIASISNAARRGRYTWRIIVTLRFDEKGLVNAIGTETSADTPL